MERLFLLAGADLLIVILYPSVGPGLFSVEKIVEMMLKLAELSLLNKNAIIVCETDQEANLPDEISGFKWIKKADYGITQLNIYEFEGGE